MIGIFNHTNPAENSNIFSLGRQSKSSKEKKCFVPPQFIHLGQTLKYYGYIKFDPCITDFPEKGCQVIVSAGNNELNFHVKLPNEQMKEGSFKVTRMRCWRVTSSVSGVECARVRMSEFTMRHLWNPKIITLKWLRIMRRPRVGRVRAAERLPVLPK